MRRHNGRKGSAHRNSFNTAIGPCTAAYNSVIDGYSVRDRSGRLIGTAFQDQPHRYSYFGSRAVFDSLAGAVRAIAARTVTA